MTRMETYPDAIDSYQQAIKLSPTELNVQFNLAMTYYKKKDYRQVARTSGKDPPPGQGRPPHPGGGLAQTAPPPGFDRAAPSPDHRPASRRMASALSVLSQVNSGSVRPKWPKAAVFL